jgi:hypothetical protein
MSAPSERASSIDCFPPGTRIISPNVARITPGTLAIAIAASTSRTEVTHTGQPGRSEGDTFGDNIADTMPENLDGMCSADLHEFQRPVDPLHQAIQFFKHLFHVIFRIS